MREAIEAAVGEEAMGWKARKLSHHSRGCALLRQFGVAPRWGGGEEKMKKIATLL